MILPRGTRGCADAHTGRRWPVLAPVPGHSGRITHDGTASNTRLYDGFVRPNELIIGFGDDGAVGKPTGEQDAVEVAQAWYQHCFVERVRSKLDAFGTSDAEFASLVGERTPETFQRKMRGEVPVRRADLFQWAILLGADVLPSVSDGSLFPPEHRAWLNEWAPASLTPAKFQQPPERTIGDIDWVTAGRSTNRQALLRDRRQRRHLADDSVLRADVVDYLLTSERLPSDVIHLDSVGHVPGVVIGPPDVATLGCVWVPDLETNDPKVIGALCRIVILLHALAKLDLPDRLAVVSITRLPAQTFGRWYPGLTDTTRGSVFTFEGTVTATLGTAAQTAILSSLPKESVIVELMTRKVRSRGHGDRQLMVLKILAHQETAAVLKLV